MHKSLKEQVLESTDIIDVIGQSVTLARKGKDYMGLCPFHNDHKPSMAVSPSKQIFKCWSCGVGGDVIKFVQLQHRTDFPQALVILAQRAGIDVTKAESDSERRSSQAREELRRVMTWAQKYFARNLLELPAGRGALEYALRRGMSQETIERFGLGFAADAWDDVLNAAGVRGISQELLQQAGLITSNEKGRVYDRFRNRLIFPIHDGQGRCVAFGGRTLGDDPAKYLNSPESPLFSKSRILYGLHGARRAIETSRQAVIVEGYVDAVMMHQAGFENVVATLGTALTDEHAKLLTPLADTMLMCFDGDQAGQKAADRGVEVALRHRVEVKVVLLPDGQDPADLVTGPGPDALKSLLHSALDALEFKWNGTVAAFGGGSDRARREAIEAFLTFVARASRAGGIDPLAQGLLAGRLGELLSVPSATIYELLAKAKGPTRPEVQRITPDTSDSSAYEASIRGLSEGIVAAVEVLIGVVLEGVPYTDRLDASLALGSGYCSAWGRLHSLLRRLAEKQESLSRADVLAHCEDGVLCELISRASARVGRECSLADEGESAGRRLAFEVEALRMAAMVASPANRELSEDERHRAFAAALELGSRQSRGYQPEDLPVLALGQRVTTTQTS